MSERVFQFRLYNPTMDHNWVHKSWQTSEREFSHAAYLSPRKLFNAASTKKIEWLLTHSITMVSYLEHEPNTLLAFMTYQFVNSWSEDRRYDALVIHYAFTKSDFRCQQIITDMLKLTNPLNLPIVITGEPNEYIFRKMNNALYDYAYFTRSYFVS